MHGIGIFHGKHPREPPRIRAPSVSGQVRRGIRRCEPLVLEPQEVAWEFCLDLEPQEVAWDFLSRTAGAC